MAATVSEWPPRVALADLTGVEQVLPVRGSSVELPIDPHGTCTHQHGQSATRHRHHTYYDPQLQRWHLRLCPLGLTAEDWQRARPLTEAARK